jgi:hypothetical protein
MPDERQFTLRQVDQARGDLYAIADDLEFLKVQVTRLPTRKELAQTALLGTLTASALGKSAIREFALSIQFHRRFSRNAMRVVCRTRNERRISLAEPSQ